MRKSQILSQEKRFHVLCLCGGVCYILVLAVFPSSDAGTGDASSKSLLRSSCSSSLWPRLDLVYGVVGLSEHTQRTLFNISDSAANN